jgi:hypothetical protein
MPATIRERGPANISGAPGAGTLIPLGYARSQETIMVAQPADQLVGRAAELASLDRALAELERRRSGALELVGEPGILSRLGVSSRAKIARAVEHAERRATGART